MDTLKTKPVNYTLEMGGFYGGWLLFKKQNKDTPGRSLVDTPQVCGLRDGGHLAAPLLPRVPASWRVAPSAAGVFLLPCSTWLSAGAHRLLRATPTPWQQQAERLGQAGCSQETPRNPGGGGDCRGDSRQQQRRQRSGWRPVQGLLGHGKASVFTLRWEAWRACNRAVTRSDRMSVGSLPPY